MKKGIKLLIITAVLASVIGGLFTWYTLSTSASKPTVVEIKHNVSQVKPNPPNVSELFTLVNAERAKKGVAPLTLDPKLNQSAQIKTDDMNNNNYFGHVDKNGKHGYQYAMEAEPTLCHTASENLHKDVIGYNTSKDVMYGWTHSAPHYAAMINPNYTITGFGISGYYITEHFC